MELLKEKIAKLNDKTNIEEQVSILQEIGKTLLTEYVIRVGDVTIKPLWIEAYYNAKGKFEDPFVHCKEEQMEFNVLYFHHKTDDQRNGVDICLSPNGNYYLSFLLKNTLINDTSEVKTQTKLSPLIRDKCETMQNKGVLVREQNSTDIISFTKRIGIDSSKEKDVKKKALKEKYEDLKLAIVRDFDKTSYSNLKGNKEKLVREYLKSKNWSREEKAQFCKKVLGYCLKEYKN